MPGAEAFAGTGRKHASNGFQADAESRGITRLSEVAARGAGESVAGGAGTSEWAARAASDAGQGRRQASPRLRSQRGRHEEVAVADEDPGVASSDRAARAASPIDGIADTHSGLDDGEGPAYEPLFGGSDDRGKRRQRPAKPPATATQRALGLLTRREHSRKELTRKLVSRGVDADEVDTAVQKLAAAGWQDDRRFAESLVRARASAGYGPLHVRAELGTHDLPADVRQGVLDAFEGNWSEIAVEIVRRRFGRIEDARLRERKAADYLIRRGFPSDIARSASRFDPSEG